MVRDATSPIHHKQTEPEFGGDNPLVLYLGGMAEWTMAAVLKTVMQATVSWVRIPLPPPLYLEHRTLRLQILDPADRNRQAAQGHRTGILPHRLPVPGTFADSGQPLRRRRCPEPTREKREPQGSRPNSRPFHSHICRRRRARHRTAPLNVEQPKARRTVEVQRSKPTISR